MNDARLDEIVEMNSGDIRNTDDFEEMATEVRRLRALVPGWRDAQTCPPAEDGKYLVCCPSADPARPLIATAWWHAGGGWSGLSDYWIPAIRHWMPLPAPPEPVTPGSPS